MKKLVLSLALVAGMTFAAMPADAQDNSENQKQETTQNQNDRPGFVDKDGDGVCDNYDGNRPGKGLGPGNGNGQGRATGKGQGRGRGNGQGAGQGQGGGGNFVDSNDNGVCDNQEDGTGRQRLRDGSGGGTGQGND